ncbi:hypothetical protein V8B97DRAFT_31531 [Scleroderma yunnanense]
MQAGTVASPLHHVLLAIDGTQLGTNDAIPCQPVPDPAQHVSVFSHGLASSDSDSHYDWTDGGSSISLPYPEPQTDSSSCSVRLRRRCREGNVDRRKANRKEKTNCDQCGKGMTWDSLRRHLNEIHRGKKRKKLQKGENGHNVSR